MRKSFLLFFSFLLLVMPIVLGNLVNVSYNFSNANIGWINISDLSISNVNDTTPQGVLVESVDWANIYISRLPGACSHANATIEEYKGERQLFLSLYTSPCTVLIEFWLTENLAITNDTNFSQRGSGLAYAGGSSGFNSDLALVNNTNNCYGVGNGGLLIKDDVYCGYDGLSPGATRGIMDIEYGTIGNMVTTNKNILIGGSPADMNLSSQSYAGQQNYKIAMGIKGSVVGRNNMSIQSFSITNLVNGSNERPTTALTYNNTALCFNTTTEQALFNYNLTVSDAEGDTIYYSLGESEVLNYTYYYDEDFTTVGNDADLSVLNTSVFIDGDYVDPYEYQFCVDCASIVWLQNEFVLRWTPDTNQFWYILQKPINKEVRILTDLYLSADEHNTTITFDSSGRNSFLPLVIEVDETNISYKVGSTTYINSQYTVQDGLINALFTTNISINSTDTIINFSTIYGNFGLDYINTTNFQSMSFSSTALAPQEYNYLNRLVIAGTTESETLDWTTDVPANPYVLDKVGSKTIVFYITDGTGVALGEYDSYSIPLSARTSYCGITNIEETNPIKIGRGFFFDFLQGTRAAGYILEILWLFFIIVFIMMVIALRNFKIALGLTSIFTFIVALFFATTPVYILFGIIMIVALGVNFIG